MAEIWYVDTKDEFSCAWTKKEDAVKYFKEYMNKEEITFMLIEGNEDPLSDDFLIYNLYDEERDFIEENQIYIIYLDEKPFWNVKER